MAPRRLGLDVGGGVSNIWPFTIELCWRVTWDFAVGSDPLFRIGEGETCAPRTALRRSLYGNTRATQPFAGFRSPAPGSVPEALGGGDDHELQSGHTAGDWRGDEDADWTRRRGDGAGRGGAARLATPAACAAGGGCARGALRADGLARRSSGVGG